MPKNEQGDILPHPKRDYRYNMDKLMDLLLRNVQIQAVFRTVQACRIEHIKVDFSSNRLLQHINVNHFRSVSG